MAHVHTILVVDDEPELREVVAAALSEADYTILTAADGYEAIRLLSERWIDLIITDVMMPGVDGFQLARQAKLMRPNIHIIYISGYCSTTRRSAGPTYGLLLPKPIRPARLVEEVQRELA